MQKALWTRHVDGHHWWETIHEMLRKFFHPQSSGLKHGRKARRPKNKSKTVYRSKCTRVTRKGGGKKQTKVYVSKLHS